MANVELRCVTASITAVSGAVACACSQSARRVSSAASAPRAETFQAMSRKSTPASANAVQPAIASARGDRLCGCALRRSTAHPPGRAALECLGAGAHEAGAVQHVLLDLNASALHPQQVEQIR